jgi:hypothetical protein
MAMYGNFITAKEASVFYKCRVEYARRKLRILALSLGKTRHHKKYEVIPDIKNISYYEFADAHNIPMTELERILK